MTNKLSILRFINKYYPWLTVLNFAFFIFFLSTVPDLKSGFETTLDIILRKLAHATEFGVLTYLIFLAFNNYRLDLKKSLIPVVLSALIYALSDEYHQSFVPGREMAFVDFLIDGMGITLAFYLIFCRINKKVIL